MNQFHEIFRKFLGVFLLVVLFAIAELAPETNAEEQNPLVGKWAGHTQNSVTEHVLRLEGDQSFTWDAGDQLLMSGIWSREQNGLDLRFGNDEADVLRFNVNLQGDHLQLTNSSATYSLVRTPGSD